jgi:pimeloyl-ACP methyl ester carboxylesterase
VASAPSTRRLGATSSVATSSARVTSRASENHGVIPEGDVPSEPISSIAVPTLVIHGSADPMFPLAHGRALAEEIPGARLLTIEGAGHGVDGADWEPIARAILAHSGFLSYP